MPQMVVFEDIAMFDNTARKVGQESDCGAHRLRNSEVSETRTFLKTKGYPNQKHVVGLRNFIKRPGFRSHLSRNG